MDLINACSKGNLADVKKAVSEGADVNKPDLAGRSALLEAAWNGNADIVKFLLEQGADPNSADKSGFTPVMRAAEEGHHLIVASLIQKGANVNNRGYVRGTTPLMLAAENGHLKVITVLLDSGAKINAVDQYEETALAKAYRTYQTKAAQLLESKGGRGKPDRSSLTHSDKELRHVTHASAPKLSGGAQDIPEEEPAADETEFDEE
ncbi:MAG: ankyrin repeat domain-containing protein [Chitinispirillales bacterium]|jgi:ankyrin repeat protein|nr:ankyrin repeat domain-containing protein [Chitinispirillales bacterium]